MPYKDPAKQREAQRLWAAKTYKDPKRRKVQQQRSLDHYHATRTNDTLEAKRQDTRKRRGVSGDSRMVTVQRDLSASNAEWDAWTAAREVTGESWDEFFRAACNAYAARRTP